MGKKLFGSFMSVRVVAALCLSALLAMGGFALYAHADDDALEAQSTSVIYLPDVTQEKSTAVYWVANQTDATDVLADRATIDALNDAAVKASNTHLQALKTMDASYLTAERQQALAAAARSELENDFVGKTYNEDWSPFTQADVDDIMSVYPTDGAAPAIASPYGVVTTHTTLRGYPTDRPLFQTYGDADDDNLYLSALRVNEPVVVHAVSTDGLFYYCTSSCLDGGWVPASDVAICADKSEWLSAWDIAEGQELVVTGYKVRTEQSNVTSNTANRLLYMGTVLERIDWEDASVLVGTRSAYNNHVCYLPVRKSDGTYSKEVCLIAEAEPVSEGYLPLTRENIANVAFNSLGEMYGWGGMLEANDCSGYVRDVYKCFGLELARNTTWQRNMPVRSYDLSGLDDAHKAAALRQMPLGTVLFMPGHEMMYLGDADGHEYVISSAGSIGNLFGDTGTTQVKGVLVNSLDIIRGNRTTWLSNLAMANMPYVSSSEPALSLYDVAFYDSAVTALDASYPYSGSPITPLVEIPGLVAGTDYEVTYADNVEPGVATVTITGTGAYTGTVKRTFEIAAPVVAPTYDMVSGDGATWQKGSDEALVFTVERSGDSAATFSHFTGISIDGVEVDSSRYTAESGSVVLTLPADLLETLDAGTHALSVAFDDGTSSASFTVEEVASNASTTSTSTHYPASGTYASSMAKTSDPFIGFLPLAMVIICAAAIGIVAFVRMRKQRKE